MSYRLTVVGEYPGRSSTRSPTVRPEFSRSLRTTCSSWIAYSPWSNLISPTSPMSSGTARSMPIDFRPQSTTAFSPVRDVTVAATVTSRTGENAVVDCGRKSIGIDRAVPELMGDVGEIKFDHGEYAIHEEHVVLKLRENSDLAVGDRVELLPGYSPTTVNLYDVYCVVEDDVIIDVWPIEARYGRSTVGIGPH